MRAARTGTRARQAASPAAASAFCHSESTRAQPRACVAIIDDLHSSYRAIGESVRAPASWPMWRTALQTSPLEVELRIRRSTLRHRVSLCTKLFVPTPGGFRRFLVGGGEWVSRERERSPERSLCSPRPVYPCASVRLCV